MEAKRCLVITDTTSDMLFSRLGLVASSMDSHSK